MEKLAENGEYPDAARGHAEYFRDLVSPVAATPRAWLNRDDVARCSRELDNVRAALDWAFSPEGDLDIGVRLTAAFAPIWQALSLIGECRDRIERMEAALPPDATVGQAGEWRMWIAYSHSLAMSLAPIERSRAAVRKALELTAGDDDVDLQAGLLFVQWSVEFTSGNHGAALIAARRLAAVTPRGGDAMRLAGDRILGSSLLCDGRLADAQDCLQRVVDFYVAPSDGHHSTLFRRDPRVLARVRLARVLSLRGALDRAWAAARASFEMAQSSGVGITACWVAHDAVCPIALIRGDLAAAEEAIAAMNDWATRLDATLWKMTATCWQGQLLIERREFARGIELISPMLEAFERSGWQMAYVPFLACLAEGLAGLGRFEEASARVERALAWADDHGERWCRPELLRLKGDLTLRRAKIPRASEAEECFRTANEVAREQGALFWELRIALGLARLRMIQGRIDEMKQLLAPVYERFTEGFEAPDLRAARALLDGRAP